MSGKITALNETHVYYPDVHTLDNAAFIIPLLFVFTSYKLCVFKCAELALANMLCAL